MHSAFTYWGGKMTLKLIYKISVENWPMFLRGAGMTLYISIISTILGSIIEIGCDTNNTYA